MSAFIIRTTEPASYGPYKGKYVAEVSHSSGGHSEIFAFETKKELDRFIIDFSHRASKSRGISGFFRRILRKD